MGYLKTHWRGEQPFAQVFWVNGVALRLVVYFALAAFTVLQPVPQILVWGAIGLDGVILIWQSVGYFRAAERGLAGSSSMLPLWGGIVAFIAVIFVVLSQWWGLVLAANPPPEEELYSTKMDRLRASQYSLSVDENGETLVFEGEITHGVTKNIAKHLNDNPNLRILEIQSAGGNIFEARGVAKLVSGAKLDTHTNGQCSSACTLVFISGKRRTAHPDARLGFHGYALMDAAKLPQFDINAEQERDLMFFASQGVSQGFLDRMYDSPNNSIWFPTHSELQEARVLTPPEN